MKFSWIAPAYLLGGSGLIRGFRNTELSFVTFFGLQKEGGGAIQILLTIAGHDPSSGAGATADLAVFAAHGFFGASALTALTEQSTVGVGAIHAVSSELLKGALECLVQDLPPAGIKVGMLATEGNVRAVIEFVLRLRDGARERVPVVLDPVVRSSSGAHLLSAAGLALLRAELLPLVDWVTPNLAELAALAECEVNTPEEMERAAARLQARCVGLNVVATGGHLQSANDLVAPADGRMEWLRGEKIASRATHGTGCAFSSSLLCGLVRGLSGVEAARQAKGYVAEAIRRAAPLGAGNGPMNLLWPLQAGQ